MTKFFILWIIVAPVGERPYALEMHKPFASMLECNNAGNFIANYMHNDLKKRFPDRTFVFNLECKPHEKVVT